VVASSIRSDGRGPLPVFERFSERARELDALTARIVHWIAVEGVLPRDIRVIVNGKTIREAVLGALQRSLRAIGAHALEERSRPFTRREDTVIVTSAHSYKGYEAEIVCVPGVDGFVTSAGVTLARPLYSALTRARSVLHVSATSGQGRAQDQLLDLFENTLAGLEQTEVDSG
jgi:superfamily I DNA/RNA helicase